MTALLLQKAPVVHKAEEAAEVDKTVENRENRNGVYLAYNDNQV
jgi:hypothetical protein